MKKLAQISILTMLLLCSGFIYGQNTAQDSVCIHLEDKAAINLAIYNYKGLAENVESDFKSLQVILKETKDIPENIAYAINYEPNKSMNIKQSEMGERIIWENGEASSYQFNKQCNISSDIYYLQIHFDELDELLSDGLLTKLLEVIDTTSNIQERYATTYNYSFEGDQLTHNQQFDEINGQMDVLMLKGGVGVNLIKSLPVIDLSAEVAIALSKKGILKNQYYVSYNLLFDFIDESKVNLNGFLNIGYRYNTSKKIDKPNWLGVELGYLINDQGDLFGGNTFKLGVNWELGKYISVSPQLYLSNDFTEFYPALRIGFGF